MICHARLEVSDDTMRKILWLLDALPRLHEVSYAMAQLEHVTDIENTYEFRTAKMIMEVGERLAGELMGLP
jgi:hypothetical protein